MANHGLIVAGDSRPTIRANTNEILGKIADRLGNDWADDVVWPAGCVHVTRMEQVRKIAPALRGLLADSESARSRSSRSTIRAIAQALVGTATGKAAALAGPLTPDQIVYCGSYPLWFTPHGDEDEAALVARLRTAIDEHKERTRFAPKIVLVEGVGLFAVGDDIKQANTARDVYLDAVKVMAGATRLGGISYLTDRERLFIEDWEVESYRRSVSLDERRRRTAQRQSGDRHRRGPGIRARNRSRPRRRRGHVALADVNEAGVTSAASELTAAHGAGTAVGLAMNVTDERVDPAARSIKWFARMAVSTCSSRTPACCGPSR